MLRMILILFVLLLAFVGLGGLYFYIRGADIMAEAIETYGAEASGAPADVAGVGLNPIAGTARIDRFELGNPEGFTGETSIAAQRIAMELSPFSLFGDTIEIGEILIDRPEIYLEPTAQGRTNLQVIQSNIEAFSGPADPNAEPANLIIGRLQINQPVLGFVGQGVGLADQEIELADIVLTDIGVEQGGVPPAELVRLLGDAILPQVQKAIASQKGREILDSVLQGQVDLDRPLADQARDKAEGALRGLLNRGEEKDKQDPSN